MKRVVVPKSKKVIFAFGLFVGILALLVVRYFSYIPAQTHYHANFAVYINGKQEKFSNPKYYQEVAVCSSTNDITKPEQRVHMHDDINSVVHVHDHVVTWGQLFSNLGWAIGLDYLITDDGTKYFASDNSQLHVLINDQDYTNINALTNMVIQDKSRVLVSFGDINHKTLEAEYKAIPATADHYDNSKDPASCAGSQKVTPKERLQHLL